MASLLNHQSLPDLDGRSFDVAVIGGGINGTSTARTLASAGYRVLLVERNDFGSGSSSRSSRLLHCGLNYLAMANDAKSLRAKLKYVTLAKNMMGERARMYRALPGRMTPKTLHIPLRKNDAVKPWQFDMAFATLKCLGGHSVPLNYRRTTERQLPSHPLAPYLGDDLVGIVSYSELAFNWPERVCVDYALTAASHGATMLNYVTLTGVERSEGGWRLTLENSLKGAHRANVFSRAVINMTGAWSDNVNKLADAEAQPTVTPNKGCHFAVRLSPAFKGIGIVNRNALGHMFICLPWNDIHIIGPSESKLNGPSDRVEARDEDIDCLLRQARSEIPGANITRGDVLFRWAGMRPATFEYDNPLGGWDRRLHVTSNSDKSLWISMSWGRLADHLITSQEILGHVSSQLRPNAPVAPVDALIPRSNELRQIVRDEGPLSVADVMFGRTGWGWSADLGRSRVPDIAAALAAASPDRTADDFAAEYLAYIEQVFGARSIEFAP